MEKIAIITDSCSDIKKEYRELYDIHVLPIQIQYESYMIYMFYQYKFNMMERVIEMA